MNSLPLPSSGRSLTTESLPIGDFTNQATVKVDHRLTERQTLSGLFAWYHSREPAPQYLGIEGDPNAIFQPRTVNVVALNHVAAPTDRMVLALRYGYLRFRDDFASSPSDPSALGFAPAFAERSADSRGSTFRVIRISRPSSMAERRPRARRTRIRRTSRCRGSPAATP